MAVGLTGILTGLDPVAVKLFVPSVTVTVYGEDPPVTSIFKFVVEPLQILVFPVKTEALGGVGTNIIKSSK